MQGQGLSRKGRPRTFVSDAKMRGLFAPEIVGAANNDANGCEWVHLRSAESRTCAL